MTAEQQREHAGDLLRLWQIVTVALLAASTEFENMEHWYEEAKRQADEMTKEQREAMVLKVVSGEITERTFRADFIEDYRRGQFPPPAGIADL